MISVVTLNYNDAVTTCDFVNRIISYQVLEHILIVDNCSTDHSLDVFNTYVNPKIEVISSYYNGGYGAGNNLGIQHISHKWNSEYILLSNPDVIVDEKTIVEMKRFLDNNQEYAIVAPFMRDVNGNKQSNTAMRIPGKWGYIFSCSILLSKVCSFFHYRDIVNNHEDVLQVDSVSGSMFLMRTQEMVKYGMYDENIFLYGEEVILGIKMRNANQKIALLPNLSFIHNHSVSISKSFGTEVKKRKLLIKSKLYIIKKYFHTNYVEYGIAYMLAKFSLVETWLLSKSKTLRKKKHSN